MIGGEFDLSAGVAVDHLRPDRAMFCYQFNLNMWVGAIVSLCSAFFIGCINGYLVVKTGIPSFLVTLGTFFVLQGANLGVTKLVTGAVATPERLGHRRFSTAEGDLRLVVQRSAVSRCGSP